MCMNKSDQNKENYNCEFEFTIYNKYENSEENKTSFTFKSVYQKDLLSNKFSAFASQPVEKLAPLKNESLTERIVSDIMICEDCNCTERKRNAIKVDEQVYLK